MAVLLMVCCGGILVCALNPALTEKIASGLYGTRPDEGQPSLFVTGTVGEQQEDAEKDDFQVFKESGDDALFSGDEGYVPPESEQQVKIPQTVNGRNGYVQIEEEANEIGEEEAELLEETLGTGETGEGLDFPAEKYPYYAMLTQELQLLYRQIYANALKMNTSYAPAERVMVGQLKNVFEAVYNDHPELFWMETGYSCKYKPNGECLEITLKYNDTVYFFEQAKLDFDKAAEEILTVSSRLNSVQEQEKYVHDALVSRVEYDGNAAMNQSAYSALVGGRSVCAGYARAFQYLLQQMDIPCYYCTGYSGEDHAWNIVGLGDGFTNVDVTWDDTEPATYDYYNQSDEEYESTHVRRGMSVYLPACGAYPAPVDVLTLDGIRTEGNTGAGLSQETEEREADLAEAGITDEEVLSTMEEYYDDCLRQMVALGSGDRQFTNVVPESQWAAVEQAYSGDAYMTGYVNEALKKLGVENFAIQLQGVRLGGGYYRLYHNIYTW
ncbi:MAG: hypothetical protein NC081_09985 [Roseburia sp.]|nr:hypothetical protein [Roseburia sp.]